MLVNDKMPMIDVLDCIGIFDLVSVVENLSKAGISESMEGH